MCVYIRTYIYTYIQVDSPRARMVTGVLFAHMGSSVHACGPRCVIFHVSLERRAGMKEAKIEPEILLYRYN